MIGCVTSQPVKVAYIPDKWRIGEVTNSLIKFYKRFSLYRQPSTDYVCGLAARYAGWTLDEKIQRRKPKALLSYALWLSLVWIIDGMVDSGRVTDLDRVMRVFAWEEFSEIEPLNPFEELVFVTHQLYTELVAPFKEAAPAAHRRLIRWTLRYFRCQGNRPATLDQYEKHRLRDGAMMCVVWHLMMYSRVGCIGGVGAKLSRQAFVSTSLIVSYHNDLLSFDRDLRQNTPNLLEHLPGATPWEKFTKGIKVINRRYKELELNKLPRSTAHVCKSILVGSHNWTIGESRYKAGMDLLRCWEAGDKKGFALALSNEQVADGDPNSA